jgi:Uncharacterized protein with SCP/PR1 domains
MNTKSSKKSTFHIAGSESKNRSLVYRIFALFTLSSLISLLLTSCMQVQVHISVAMLPTAGIEMYSTTSGITPQPVVYSHETGSTVDPTPSQTAVDQEETPILDATQVAAIEATSFAELITLPTMTPTSQTVAATSQTQQATVPVPSATPEAVPTLVPTSTPLSYPLNSGLPNDEQRAQALEAALIQLINNLRAEYGLAPYKVSPELSRAARAHSCDIAAHSMISHLSSDGRSLKERLAGAEPPWEWPSENIAAGTDDPARVIYIWMDEPEDGWHRRNLLNPDKTEIGAGYCFNPNDPSNNRHYWTIDIASRSY